MPATARGRPDLTRSLRIFFIISLLVMLAACAASTPYKQGQVHYESGEYAEAIEAYSQVIVNPSSDRELFRALYQGAKVHRERQS